MGFCRSRYFMLVICFLQFVAVIQRQVFDFLGFLWIPILINFFEIIFVIFGVFGSFQYRPKYIITYALWNLVWLGWNIFLICLYLDVGILNHKENIVLKLDSQSISWWINGPGCKTLKIEVPDNVIECLVKYEHVEMFQAGLQCFLAFFGIISGLCLSKMFLEEDDSFNYLVGDGKNPQHLALQPMYVNGDTDSFLPSFAQTLLPIHGSEVSLTQSTGDDTSTVILYDKYFLANDKTNRSTGRAAAVYADHIRFTSPPLYLSNSFDKVNVQPKLENVVRPKSLYASSNFL